MTPEKLQELERLRLAGFTPDAALRIVNGSSESAQQPAEDKNYLQKVYNTAKAGVGHIADTIKTGAEVVQNTAPGSYGRALGAINTVAGTIAGAGEALFSPVTPAISSAISSIPGAEQTMQKINEVISDYTKNLSPMEQKTLSNVVEAGSTLAGFKGTKVAGGVGAQIAKDTAKSVKDLHSVFGVNTAGLGQKAFDKAVVGVADVTKKAKAVPERVAKSVRESVDRTNLALPVEEAQKKIVDLYKQGIVPGVKKKKKTTANIKAIDDAVVRTTKDLSKYDVNDIQSYSEAVIAEKRNLWSKIEEQLKNADKKGVEIDLHPIVAKLDDLLESDRAKFNPNIKKAIEKAKKRFVDENGKPMKIKPTSAQDVLSDLNSELQAFYRGTAQGTVADGLVLAGVAQDLRKFVDSAVDKLKGKSYDTLKKKYKDLKKIEDDVVHRAVFEAQKGAGLGQYADMFAAGDILGGMIGTNPAFLAKGLGTFFTKEVVKALNDKNEFIRQMFVIGKNLRKKSSKVHNPPKDIKLSSTSLNDSIKEVKSILGKDHKLVKEIVKTEKELSKAQALLKTLKDAELIKKTKAMIAGLIEKLKKLVNEARELEGKTNKQEAHSKKK